MLLVLVVGSPLTLASQQGVACFNFSNKIIKNFPRISLARFLKIKLLSGHLISQVAKVILFLVALALQLLSC